MMKIVKAGSAGFDYIRTMGIQQDNSVERTVDEIIANVRKDGDAALRYYSEKFDHCRLQSLTVTSEEQDKAFREADAYYLETLKLAAENIRAFHRRQLRQSFIDAGQNGVVIGQKLIPLARVGIYVPGGTAAYPSSVLMNAIPPQLAGVSDIIMATPPGPDGSVAPAILTAAKIAGVTSIVKVGGAQAIAAMAYGTKIVPRVDKIVGPGNIYVATAKRRVYGQVDIDMIAGPSEILIIADSGSDARHVAADLLSQAEHDALATAILITDSEALAYAVQSEVERQLALLPRREIAAASIEANGVIVCVDSLETALKAANEAAPEHLELCVDDPFAWLPSVRNAGSVFMGRHTPEALGDYFAGPNHTLPTSGTARFSSPLSVDDFVKKTQFLYYTKDALANVSEHVADFARREGLTGHARSVQSRFWKEDA